MILLFVAPLLAFIVYAQKCYWPDGSYDPRGYVCNVTAAAEGGSACCLADDACFASGSCYQDWSGYTYRQSCTDPTWRAEGCPTMCVSDNQDSVNHIQQCDMKNALACCTSDGTNCCSNSTQFQWKPGYIVAVLNGDGSNRLGPFVDGDGSTATTGSSVLEARPATVSSGSSPATSSVAAGSTTASAISGSGTETVSITGSASPLSTSSTPSNSAQGDSVGRTVGLGVGIPVAAISAAGAIGFFFLYRRLKRAKTQNAESGGLPTRPTPSEKSFKISSPLEVAARGPQKPLPNFPPLELASHERSELDAVGNKKHVGLV